MRRSWWSEEPSLGEVVNDPIVIMMMRTDGVTPDALWTVIRAARRRLEGHGRRAEESTAVVSAPHDDRKLSDHIVRSAC